MRFTVAQDASLVMAPKVMLEQHALNLQQHVQWTLYTERLNLYSVM